MNKYFSDDMELNVLTCLLIKPELMNDLILEDKYFKRYKRMWTFMKAYYSKYHNFDINVMFAICKNKRELVDYLQILVCNDAFVSHFEQYQIKLKEEVDEEQKDKYIIGKLYTLVNDLIVRKITVAEFKEKSEKIYADAEVIYKKEGT